MYIIREFITPTPRPNPNDIVVRFLRLVFDINMLFTNTQNIVANYSDFLKNSLTDAVTLRKFTPNIPIY